MTDRIFFAKGNACVSKNSFHAIGLLCKTQIFRPAFKVLLANGLLALKTEIFLQLLIFSFTEQYWLFGHLSRLTSHSSTAQERSEAIWGKFHRWRLQHDVKTFAPWYSFCWFHRTRQSSRMPSMKSAAPFTYLKSAQRNPFLETRYTFFGYSLPL